MASILIFWLLLVYHGWNLFKANERIKNLLLLELTPVLGDGLKIDQVRVGLGTIHVMGIAVHFPNKPYSITAEHLQADYNLIRLVTNRFDPKKFSDDFYIKGLKVIIHSDFKSGEDDSAQAAAAPPRKQFSEIYRNAIRELRFLRHIAILNSEIVYQDSTGEKQLIHSIFGWISSDASGLAELRVTGNLFASEQVNVSITGRVNINTGDIDSLSGDIRPYPLRSGIPLPIADKLKFSSGVIQGEIKVVKSPERPDGLKITGLANLSDCAVELPQQKVSIDSFTTQLYLTDSQLEIPKATGKINQTRVFFSGKIDSIFKPHLNLTFSSAKFEPRLFFKPFKIDWIEKARGALQITGTLAGNPKSLVMTAALSGNRIRFLNQSLKNLALSASLEQKKLRISSLEFELDDFQINGNGILFFNSPGQRFHTQLSVRKFWGPHHFNILADSTFSISSALQLAMSGYLREPKVNGTFGVTLISPYGQFSLPGKFHYFDRELSVTSHADSIPGFGLGGQVNLAQKSPITFFIDITQAEAPILALLNLPFEAELGRKLHFNLSARGWPGNFEIFGQTQYQPAAEQQGQNIFLFTLNHRTRSDQAISQCLFKVWPDAPEPIPGLLKLITTREGVEVKEFQFGASVSGAARIPFDKNAALSGHITIQNAKINDYCPIPDSTFKGQIAANLEFSGTVQQPQFTGQASLYEAYYKYFIGPYTSAVDFHYHPSTGFTLSSLALNRADTTLLSAKGTFDHLKDRLNFNLVGTGFNIEAYQFLFPEGKPFLRGKTFLNVAIDGPLKKPVVRGDVLIEKGKLWSVPFDGFDLSFGTPNELPPFNHNNALQLEQIRLWRGDEFQLRGSGFLPLRSSEPWSLDFRGHGNLLFFLPNLIDFFQVASAPGEIELHIGGLQQQPRLTRGKLQFKDGRLEMESVVSDVTRLEGRLEYDADKNYVRIQKLDGAMGNVPFSIRNIAVDTLTDKSLQPFYFKPLGLGCGILTFFTPKEGIPLNFVGLMENGDFGKFRLLGLKENEPFMFTGPVSRPVIRGKIVASNMSFMYPFTESKNVNKNSGITWFLENLYWDLMVVPDKGVRYQRSFPGAFDEVFVNLQLDDNYGNLHMTGIVADSSFRIEGQARSTQGDVEYLNMNFRIQEAGVFFDRTSIEPIVYGRAVTNITDSTGFSNPIFLSLSTLDHTLEDNHHYELVKDEQERGRWSNVHFRLSSNNPSLGDSEGQLLIALGYSPEALQERAFDAVGNITDNLLLRPIFRPIERHIARTFGLDYVRFNSQFTRNLIAQNVYENYVGVSKLSLLRSSRLMMGKYLHERVFMYYSGSVEVGADYRLQFPGIGLHHTIDLEYRISPQLLIEMAYDYDGLMRKNRLDRRILIRHWFPF